MTTRRKPGKAGKTSTAPRKATAGTYRRPGPKDSKGLSPALANVIGHRDS